MIRQTPSGVKTTVILSKTFDLSQITLSFLVISSMKNRKEIRSFIYVCIKSICPFGVSVNLMIMI